MDFRKHKGAFGGDENVLYPDICQKPWTCLLSTGMYYYMQTVPQCVGKESRVASTILMLYTLPLFEVCSKRLLLLQQNTSSGRNGLMKGEREPQCSLLRGLEAVGDRPFFLGAYNKIRNVYS